MLQRYGARAVWLIELGRVGVLGLILLLVCLYGEALPYPFMLLTLFAALGLSL